MVSTEIQEALNKQVNEELYLNIFNLNAKLKFFSRKTSYLQV